MDIASIAAAFVAAQAGQVQTAVAAKMLRMNAHHHPHLEALQAVALDSARVAAGSPREAVPLVQRRRISSQTLMGNDREVEIEHAGSLYRLRVTSLGKLILTK